MIIETVVATKAENKYIHLAALGAKFVDDKVFLYPYQGTKTLANILKEKSGTINIVDKAEYLVKSALGNGSFELQSADKTDNYYLADCCHYYEFEMLSFKQMENKYEIEAKIINDKFIREYLGFNRAANLLVEAAVTASRIGISSEAEDLLSFLDKHKRVIFKTGNKKAKETFDYLKKYAHDLGGKKIDNS